jgi:CubicO group peptidase (beta-lactamase class C family)
MHVFSSILHSWRDTARLCCLAGFVLFAIAVQARADAVDDYLTLRMAREHIPGLSLVVVRHGKIVKAKGYGYASLEHKAPARTDTVYDLASTTKPFVATAIMLLKQDGKLSLDDTVGKFIDNVPETWKVITVRQLLSQTSGIKDYLADLNHDFPNEAPPEEIVKAAMDAPLNFTSGAKWQYSNTGYVVLGMIVKKVSGQTYDALLQERVFGPLRMTDTLRHTPDGVIPHRASGYLYYGGFRNADFLRYMMTNHGDRGLLSTALDLAKFDAALSSGKVLNAESMKAMWTPVITFDGGYTYPFSYGLGWFIKTFNGHKQISHPGGAPGTGAILSRYPDDDLTVILLANGGKAFIQELDLGVARHYIPGLMAAKPVKLSPARIDSITGYYNVFGSQLLKVVREGDGLFIDDGGGVNNEFIPVSDTEFVAEEPDRGFTVARDANGMVTSATLRLGKDKMPVSQRIGPLARTVEPEADRDPALTRKIAAVLKALARGGKAVEEVEMMAPQARKDYAPWPSQELAGTRGITYVTTRDVAGKGIERHGAKVSRVVYYRMLTDHGARFVLVYLTEDGLVTDQDVVE